MQTSFIVHIYNQRNPKTPLYITITKFKMHLITSDGHNHQYRLEKECCGRSHHPTQAVKCTQRLLISSTVWMRKPNNAKFYSLA